MTWTEALPAVASSALVLLLPGLLAGAALGVRGPLLAALAPPLSVTVVAGTALVAGAAEVPWGVPVVAAATVGAVLLASLGALAVSVAAGRFRPPAASHATAGRLPADGPAGARRPAGASGWFAVAVAVGGALLAWRITAALPDPSLVSQTYDGPYHLNAVAKVLEDRNASSLHVGTLNVPLAGSAFYPAAWHGVVSLVVLVSGVSIPVATLATGLVVAALVWPLSVLALARAVAGDHPAVLLGSGVLAAASGAFPVLLLDFGVLYPNLLAFALLPAVAAAAVAALLPVTVRPGAREAAPERRAAALLAVVAAVPGLALAHPNALFSAVVVIGPLVVAAALRAGGLGWSVSGVVGRAGVVVAGAAAVAVTVVGYTVVSSSAAVAVLRGTDWEATRSWPRAVYEVLTVAPVGRPVTWPLAVLTLVGIVAALATPRLRWLPVSHAVLGWLYAVAVVLDTPLSLEVTGYWYNDAFRIGALMPGTAVPLAAVGLLALLRWAGRRGRRPGSTGASTGGGDERVSVHRAGPAGRSAAPVGRALGAATVAGLVYVTSLGPSQTVPYLALTEAYDPADPVGLLTADERALLDRLPRHVPADDAVIGNPWDGSAFAWALTGRETIYPHLTTNLEGARGVVAEELVLAGEDPQVCEAVAELDAPWVLDFGPQYLWGGDPDGRDRRYPGVEAAVDTGALELVDEVGDARLYRVEACDS